MTIIDDEDPDYIKNFFEKANIIIYAYDSTNEESLNNLEKKWYHLVDNQENIQDSEFKGVVETKSDLGKKNLSKKGELFSQKINGYFSITSSINNIGIENIFNSLLDDFFSVYVKKNYFDSKNKTQGNKKNKNEK